LSLSFFRIRVVFCVVLVSSATMGKRAVEEVETGEVDEQAKAERKKAKKAKKEAAAAEAAAAAEEEEAEAARIERKKAKKAKKAAAAIAAEAEENAPAPKLEKKKADPAPKKEEPAKAVAAEDEEFKDDTYKCCDCSEDWVDTADDQQFRWDKGFAETPKRCKDCRWAKKVRMEGGDPTAKGKGKGKKGGRGNNDLTVFVRGLPFACTEEQLNKDFAECGEMVSCRMPLNEEGTCKGIAFIEYTAKEGCDKALAFDETEYGGRYLNVRMAGDSPPAKGKDGKGKGKDGKGDKGKGKKGKKGSKAPSESFSKNTGALLESTGVKKVFADSDNE